MYNFLEDTLEELHDNKKTEKDVLWVGSYDGEYSITWELFQGIAKNINYRNDFHATFIPSDLVVVGDGWEGSEYWLFIQPPTNPTSEAKGFSVLCDPDDMRFYHIADLNKGTTDEQLVKEGS